MTYLCKKCGKGDLTRDAYYTHTDGRRYKTCRVCISKYNNAKKSKKFRGEKLLLTGGISYKLVLPPDKWWLVEQYLGMLLYCADMAHKEGIKPDVWRFTRVYAGRGTKEERGGSR